MDTSDHQTTAIVKENPIMHPHLQTDLATFDELLHATMAEALAHLHGIDAKAPNAARQPQDAPALPADGLGAGATLALFRAQYAAAMTASSGPRYWGFVTGGSTPAALMGDWLASAYDINLADRDGSAAPTLELHAIALLRQLFGLPDTFHGVFVSGATMSNMAGLAMGREWASQRAGYTASQSGLYGHAPIPLLSAAPHSSVSKALAILGMGRAAITPIKRMDGNREAVDLADLARHLQALDGRPCIVIGNAGTVNTTDFDDLNGIADLQARYPFWLHVDGAFGGFAACSPAHRHLVDGMARADSLTVDAHKWLNVPYDSAMIFTRHLSTQTSVFQNIAAYLPDLGPEPDFFHLTPENSRRFRALPAWFSLMAYGRAGYEEIVARCCALAVQLGEQISASTHFRLLAPVRLNIVCFTLVSADSAQISAFLHRLRDDGRVFLTPTTYNGTAGIRAAFSNWRTQPHDLALAWQALQDTANAVLRA
jgi:glutamate/tyrosine decarboxylase-like PLP-dependent enzyme